MNILTSVVILTCGINICDAGYGYGGSPETQSDVQAPSYAPPYAKTRYSSTGTKTYSGRKTSYRKSYSGTKTGYGGTKSAYGETKTWHSDTGSAPTYEEFANNANQPYQAICEPDCKNNGICVDTNTCHCPPNFKGQYCEIQAKPCLSYPPLPMNSLRKCSPDFCTITCFEGYKFAGLGTTVANMKCGVDGTWQPTMALLAAIPDCEPQCTPPCQNGGVCLSVDTCQCPAEFKGPQCQYATSACDVRKLGFNGGYNCFGDGDSFSCTLSCPTGVAFSAPAADLYTCAYATGQFLPQPIPHCVYGENMVVIPGHARNSSYYEYHSTGGHASGTEFEQQNSGFEQQNSGFEQQNSGFEQQSGWEQQGGFEQQQGFEQEIGGFEQQNSGFEQQSGFEGFTSKPVKMVVQDFTPKGGVCMTWAGVHYKTFDGKIYSFQSPCQHVLLRDRQEHKFTVALQQGDCKRKAYCPPELSIYLEDRLYVLSVGEDGSVVFRNSKRLIPMPASLEGIRVAMPSDYVIVHLDSNGVTIKWDTNTLIVVEGTAQLWNNTEGLCGTLNGNQGDDFLMKDGAVAPTQAAFTSSWHVNKIGDVCTSNPSELNACAARSEAEVKEAKLFCASVFSRQKFQRCSKVMDVSQLLGTCQWDHCACAPTLNQQECACATVSVYAKECLRSGVQEMRHWRDADTCPMTCPDGKIYQACGPDSQPSCTSPSVATTVDNATCVEGCFCPPETLLEGGKCVPRTECPCRLRNKSFKNGAVVTKDCNTCTCVSGAWSCTAAACGARCGAIGDPHYTTFDGQRYDFMGRCTYHLLRTGNLSIEVENVACSGAISEAMNLTPYEGSGKPSCTKSLTIKYNGASIHLKQGGYILVNGQEVSALPVTVHDVRIRAASSLFVMVQLPNRVDVWWDGSTRVFVDVPPEFHDKTKGLCGTFNLNQKDDFLTPEGDIEQSVYAFANKWKTRELCEDVSLQEPEHPCKTNVENKALAERLCGKLKSKLFESCHWHVDVEAYHAACVYDVCACAGDAARCLCPALGDYAMACARQNVHIQWRYNVQECELSCTGGQEYTVCADSCLRTCTDVSMEGTGVCKPSCVEGCACKPGQVLNENNLCVPHGLCPCYHKGQKFDPGYKEVRPGRRERELCTCVGARWECTPASPSDIQNYPPAEDLRSNCSAANNQEFTTCLTAEPLTCKNMHLPPSSESAECRAGCQCKRGFVLDAGSGRCVRAEACPCHHGGRSFVDGHTMREDCNTCECKNGNWSCTTKKCAGVCSAWGDSHVTTFDGTDYDFEGVCTYMLAKGVLDAKDGFDVEIQNVPCGTTGATCSKSITLRVGTGNNEEIVSLTKDAPLPKLDKLKRIKLRTVGAYIFLDVPSLGMSVQWDKQMRVYVKVDAMWQGRLKGLCGNYNADQRDDFQTPAGGIPESSALLFVDSWKMKTTCPKPLAVRDHCKQRPERKEWATSVCGALKQPPFTQCHSEVPPSAHVERCERDACACDAGGDCVCACAALAHYAQLCASRGVPLKWRTQELCPMQCDEECATYDACLSSCPLETCDNTLDYPEIQAVCEKDACLEGCKPKKACAEGSVFTNDTFSECVPRSRCRRVCMSLPAGVELLEGQITEEDACHTCRCSKKAIVCTGQPCSSALPYVVTEAPAHKSNDEPLKCATGWSPWVNRGPPETGPTGDSLEKEPLPKPNELQIGQPLCTTDKMTQIECRTTVNHKSAKETGLDVECSLERGLVCKEKGGLCPDFEIRVFCQCEPKTDEPFQCLNSEHPNYPHPTECAMFYECTPDERNPLKKHAVLKSCGAGLMYNPVAMVCDWPNSVAAVRPECGTSTPQSTTVTAKSTTVAATTHIPVTTVGRCPPGYNYSDCAFPCKQLCHHFKRVLLDKGRCIGSEICVEGCIPAQCKSGRFWRDENTCVAPGDCTCYSNGKILKPAQVATDGCIKCQCLENDLHCDTTDCTSPQPRALPTSPPTAEPTTTTEKVIATTVEATTLWIVKNTASPPPDCVPGRYKNLLWEGEPLPATAFEASSIANDLFAPQYAQLNAHPIDMNAGSWSPAVEDDQQYIQVTLPRREPVYGVILQGSPLFDQYVTSYQVLYSSDSHAFSLVEGADGRPKTFRGPVDHNNPMKQMFEAPIETKVVRLRPLTWHDSISVRFELVGCDEASGTQAVTTPEPIQCTEPLGLAAQLPVESIEVSSNLDLRPHLRLDGERGWKPAYSTPGEWIMFDFTSPRNITGVKTRGGPTGWVTAYNIYYTSDLSTFNPVLDNTGSQKLFPGNYDKDSTVFNEFRPPIHAKYLKVIPIKWKNGIEMRVEPIGCFEPYPVTEVIIEHTTPPSIPTCELCPGVLPPSACDCRSPLHFDGEGCVSRDQCPCVEGFMTYAVGSTFLGSACDECVCKLGGVTICKPVKQCDCAPDLVPKLIKSSCECSCEACPNDTRICPTSKLCLPLNKWCDGLQDCPDDEKDCEQKQRIVVTTEAPMVTTQAMTVGVTATTVAVTTAKPQKCPEVSCPTGYFVRYTSSSSYSRSTSDLPPPRPRNSYSRYTKGGYTKGGYRKGGYSKGGYSKGGYSKGGYSKGGLSFSKGGQTPAPFTTTTSQPNTTPSNKSQTQECRQFKCIPNLPPPFKPGATPAPVVCSATVCPLGYTLKLDTVPTGANQCPQYVCVPPPEQYAYCNMTGRTFNTFDGAEYKFDVCYHTLARDAKFKAWSVQVQKMCSVDGCVNHLILQQDGDTILVKPTLMIQYNNYEYTVEQTTKICFQKNSFDVNKIGNGLAIKSRRYDFEVYYTTDGSVKVAVNTKSQGYVDGLCGFYDGDVSNERRKPDRSYATSIDEFAHSWAKAGLRPDACEIKLIPPEKQRRAWDLCDVITKDPFTRCSKVLNLDKWRSICLEKTCECADLVINGTRRSDEECRCLFLDTLVAQCLAADGSVDLGDWRMLMDCPAECAPPLVHYDCYRRRCEPSCSSLGASSRLCPVEGGQCFPGCYCPDGKLRKGDTCVTPQECLDCVCNGVGAPAKYVSFEGDDIPFLGNCTYLASRDRNDTGKHIYEVYATNGPCATNDKAVCTKSLHILYDKNVILVTRDDVSKKLVTTVNDKPVYGALSNDWLSVGFAGNEVTLLLSDAHVEIKVHQSKMEFSVRVSSHLYANRTEGLCGVCAGYEDALITSNGTVAEDFEEYGKSWQATADTLTSLGIPLQEECGDFPPPPPCRPPPPESNPCYRLLDAGRFGACHALLDPHTYIESCEEELCTQNSTDICSILERYAAECRRQHVCLDWRGDLCPYPCESPFVYSTCVSCERTCENSDEHDCSAPPAEGCFCPTGKVRVNSTCIEASKCFPCDANKEHFAGDEWQEDACTKCTCSKVSEDRAAHVSCTRQTCAPPACARDDELVTRQGPPAACCPDYVCVPAAKKATCEEPKRMECGFGQVLKQKTGADGCPLFTCECKPASECERIPGPNEVELLEPGMERVIDNTSCCPRVLMLCRAEHCPPAPRCPQYHDLVTDRPSGKCCPVYRCEAPKNKCIVSLEWEATPKGGEKLKPKPEVVLKDLDSQWVDGPCRVCVCRNSPLGPGSQCSLTECPALPASEQFVLEPRPVPFACCPAVLYAACRDRDNIYKAGENWTSAENACEWYRCARAGDGKLEVLTTVQACHTDCDPGWAYAPPPPNSGQCCGRCKPVACVCEGVEHAIGETWSSPDHCARYTCVDTNGTLQVQSSNESCPEVSVEMKKQFVMKEETVAGQCCKVWEPVACRVGDNIYQEGQTWQSADPCKKYTCARDSTGRLTLKESVETCARDCTAGWEYKEPLDGVCCGACVQTACVVDGLIKPAGSTWHSADNCTDYSCDRSGDSLSVTISKMSCPDVSSCALEDLVNDTCCPVCRERPQALSTCVPTPLGVDSVGAIRVHLHGRGWCANREPVTRFKECRGTCDSGTIYNNQTGSHDSKCECCQATKYEPVTVEVTCEDGSRRQHRVASPAACACRRCSGEQQQQETDEIPEIYQRFGSSPPPRKYRSIGFPDVF